MRAMESMKASHAREMAQVVNMYNPSDVDRRLSMSLPPSSSDFDNRRLSFSVPAAHRMGNVTNNRASTLDNNIMWRNARDEIPDKPPQ
jgi:hypothetical protein